MDPRSNISDCLCAMRRGSPVSFIEPAPYGNYATTERSNFPSKLVSCRYCSSMLVFGEPMRWVTCIAAPILLADVGNHCFGVFSLDLKRGDERIFGVHGDVVRLPFQFKPDGELHSHASYSHYFGADIHRCPAHA